MFFILILILILIMIFSLRPPAVGRMMFDSSMVTTVARSRPSTSCSSNVKKTISITINITIIVVVNIINIIVNLKQGHLLCLDLCLFSPSPPLSPLIVGQFLSQSLNYSRSTSWNISNIAVGTSCKISRWSNSLRAPPGQMSQCSHNVFLFLLNKVTHLKTLRRRGHKKLAFSPLQSLINVEKCCLCAKKAISWLWNEM